MESRVEQFEQIRRDRDREGLSIRGLAVRHGVHRRAVRQALLSPVPPAKRSPVGRPAPKLGPYRGVIDGWLEADREAPRKQRHTAKRIWQRIVDEHGADVAETTVRQYVRGRKRAMGWPVAEVFVPQVHAPGMEAEVDWGEAEVVLAGVATTVHLFVMRASFSGAAFCQASLVETQQAFLELLFFPQLLFTQPMLAFVFPAPSRPSVPPSVAAGTPSKAPLFPRGAWTRSVLVRSLISCWLDSA